MNTMFLKKIDALAGRVAVFLLPKPKYATAQEDCRKILIIRPGGIGDAVLLVPTLAEIKKAFPRSIITVLAERRNASVFSLTAAVDKVLLYHNPVDMMSVIRDRFDVVVDTEQWHRLSAVVSRLVRAGVSIGYATNGRKRLFTHSVNYSHQDYEPVSFHNLLRPLGIVPAEEFPPPFLSVPSSAVTKARRILGSVFKTPFIVIFAGTSVPEKQWGIQRFQELVSLLKNKSHRIVVIGGSDDVDDAARILSSGEGLNLAGRTTLAESAAIIQKAKVLVSADSGVLHLACGLGTPSVALFGPSNVRKWAPRGDRHIVLHQAMSCSPCSVFGHTPRCRFKAKCMAGITVEEVADAVVSLFG